MKNGYAFKKKVECLSFGGMLMLMLMLILMLMLLIIIIIIIIIIQKCICLRAGLTALLPITKPAQRKHKNSILQIHKNEHSTHKIQKVRQEKEI